MGDKPAIDAWVNPVLGDSPNHELTYLFPALAERRKKALSAEAMIEMMDDMDWVRRTVRGHPEASDYPLLTMERRIDEIADMPFKDEERRRKYLGDNARRVILGEEIA